MPVSNYAAEFLELYRRAARETLTIDLPSERAAIRLRYRLHNLRKEFRKENHPLRNISEGVQLSIKNLEGGTAQLIAHPADADYLGALRKAGIDIEDMPDLVEGPASTIPDPISLYFAKEYKEDDPKP